MANSRSHQRLGHQRLDQRRRGVTILEVLFAILITAIGLMGAIAVFPAAMLQTRRGQQADATAVAGLSAIHAFDVQAMRRPDRWMYFNGSNYLQVSDPSSTVPLNGTFAFCIDPRFVAAQSAAGNPIKSNANFFPYGATASGMARVTLHNGLPTTNTNSGPMNFLAADEYFIIPDDISYDRLLDRRIGDDTMHSSSTFVRDGSNNALKRQSEGHMSWMATLTPKLERVASGASIEDRYVLSIVVFYDRPAQLQADPAQYPPTEWACDVALDSGGVNGGEITISSAISLEQVDVRAGQWIMLMAQTRIPNNNSGHRMPLCRWYRVIDADQPVQSGANYINRVSLAGADFTDNSYLTFIPFTNSDPAPYIKAIVCQGVVAVYEKTIKLESRL